MNVPYIDLKRQYESIKKEIDQALQDTIESCAFVAGKKVQQFERHFAEYCSCEHAIGISSGTSALYVALKALSIGHTDIVVTVPFTFIATAEAISLTGAQPVFVDIDSDSFTMSVEALQSYIQVCCEWRAAEKMLVDTALQKRVKAIMPVHLYGQVADMDGIMTIADQYHLSVIEDAAQAHGASYGNKKAGSIGHIGCFSYYPTKNLGAYGQGGAITTNQKDLADKIRKFINHGQNDKYLHAFEGWNFKMDGFQAAILDAKLHYLDTWNQTRRNHAKMYMDKLKSNNGMILPKEMPGREHVYHLFVIRVPDRPSFEQYLTDRSIGYTIAYPVPLHLQPPYKDLGYKSGDFPNAEKAAKEVIGLPVFPELTDDEIEYVCSCLNAWPRER
jgi:dTDP-4-amino-4,6-dideoxygalactose transaminase